MNIFELTELIRKTEGCILDPPSKIPQVRSGHVLPEDVLIFYQLNGGGVLFKNTEYRLHIVKPEKFLLANPIILALSEEELSATKDEMSWSWYILGEGESGEYITIDLAPARLGRCYYSFWDCHAMEGYSPVIAWSFTDFLARILKNQGNGWYWEKPDFESLGDAYDHLEQ